MILSRSSLGAENVLSLSKGEHSTHINSVGACNAFNHHFKFHNIIKHQAPDWGFREIMRLTTSIFYPVNAHIFHYHTPKEKVIVDC